jgi:hypothetical protein
MSSSIGRLRWAVKESFIDYVRGLSDGTIKTPTGLPGGGNDHAA